MIVYTYIIDNNERFSEDHRNCSVLSLEKLTPEQFEEAVQIAFENAKSSMIEDIREELLLDSRFFAPKVISEAFIGHGTDGSDEENDYETKIRGFKHY